ncbi:transglycosylase family protein [Streptomyces sp. NPDC050997]|uniref:transglycosylase family protein n=1 Tax=Streptomyces sp. NPDC050997 TaxID=3155519 RepID=UPI003447BF51
MLSGNGRHRRPRQAPALLVAAGVTGSAIAIPLLGATGASAATGTTWDQVANCETEGSWSANDGDGHYGGLHIAQKDWDEYGGLDYAPRADQASRNQQIAVAEKILADQGVGYWSTCGLLNGLTKDSQAADVDTGVGSGEGSEESSDSGSSGLLGSDGSSTGSSGNGSSDEASGTPSASASKTPSDSSEAPSDGSSRAGNSAKSGTSADSGSGSSDSQASDSPSTSAAKQDDSDNSWRVGGSSSLVDTGALGGGKHRGDSADEDAAADTADTGTSAGRHAAGGEYTVRVGDTLESIADSLDLQGGWRALYEENKQAIGSDPSHIAPGQTLGLGAE